MSKNTKSLLMWGAILGLFYWFWKNHTAKKA